MKKTIDNKQWQRCDMGDYVFCNIIADHISKYGNGAASGLTAGFMV
ncbi:MAG: hypothetical protein II875_13500 [Clostridia bacterium]|nr:hypothetical protein [Clostridia bacterium]